MPQEVELDPNIVENLKHGDIITLGFDYNRYEAGTRLMVVETNGSFECKVNGAPAALSFRLIPESVGDQICDALDEAFPD